MAAERPRVFQSRVPILEPGGHPQWWHHHGSKIKIDEGSYRGMIILRGSAAQLTITGNPLEENGKRQYDLRWIIRQGGSSSMEGRINISETTLKAAFGFDDSSDVTGRWLIDRYGATSAEQGAYIRFGEYLNIPGPGSGHDGDPNISLEVTEPIQAAVKDLLIDQH